MTLMDNSVDSKVHDHGFDPPRYPSTSRWTDHLRQKVKTLWSNRSALEISVLLWEQDGIIFTRSAVIGLLHRMGLSLGDKSELHPMTRNLGVPRLVSSAPRIRKPSRPSPDIIALRCVEIEPLNKTLLELEDGDCRYPVNDGGPYLFCGHPSPKGKNLCVPHHDLCWLPPGSPKEPGRQRV